MASLKPNSGSELNQFQYIAEMRELKHVALHIAMLNAPKYVRSVNIDVVNANWTLTIPMVRFNQIFDDAPPAWTAIAFCVFSRAPNHFIIGYNIRFS